MPRILAHNLNFAPEGIKQTILDEHSVMRMGAAGLTDITGECGFGGLDYRAVRSPAYAQLRFAGGKLARTQLRPTPQTEPDLATQEGEAEAEASGVRRLLAATFVLREGFRGVANPVPKTDAYERRDPAETKDSLPYSLILWGSFPPSFRSFQRLQRTSRLLGYSNQMSHIVYPDPEGSIARDRQMSAMCENKCQVQPNADLLAAWRVDSPGGLVNALGERNMQVAYCPLEFTRQGKAVNLQLKQKEYLPALLRAGLVESLQIPLCRNDFRKVDPERTEMTFDEGRAFVRDQKLPRDPTGRDRDLATTFELFEEAGWEGDVTIKATLGNLAAASALGFITPAGMRRRFKDIVMRTRREMPQVEAQNWLPMPKRAWPPQQT